MKNPDYDRHHSDAWDDHFRQRFADYQHEPPADALNRILAGLSPTTPTPAVVSGGRSLQWWLGRLGIAAMLVGSTVVTQLPDASISAASVASPTRVEKQQVQVKQATQTQPAQQVRVNLVAETGRTAVPTTESAKTAPRPDTKEVMEQPVLATAPAQTRTRERSQAVIPTYAGTPERAARVSNRTENDAPVAKTLDEKKPEGGNSQRTVSTVLPVSTQSIPSVPADAEALMAPASQTEIPASTNSIIEALVEQRLVANPATHNPMRALSISLLLPAVTVPAQPETAPKQPVVQRKRAIVFASVMPLYTYQTIDPVADDEILVRNIRTQKAFSGQRAGVRLQAGIEWPLSRWVHLRTSLSYNQLSQSLSYSTPKNRPDSIRIERVDASTVRVTPYYNDKQLSSQTQWHHVGLGTDLVWQLGKLGAWQHSITTGASVGAFVSQKSPYFSKPITGFVQASYGIERPLTRTLWLRVAPTVQYGLNRVSDAEGLFIIRPYTYGLTIGIRK